MAGKRFSIKDQYLLEVICTFRRTLKTQENTRSLLLGSSGRSHPTKFIFCVYGFIFFICAIKFVQRGKTLHKTHHEKATQKAHFKLIVDLLLAQHYFHFIK